MCSSSEFFPGETATGLAHRHGTFLSEQDAAVAVGRLARAAHQMGPAAVGAGVSLLEAGGTWVSTAATGPAVEAADAAQYDLGQGPCLSAWATGDPQRIDDTALDGRWARWQAVAAAAGIRSSLSTPLVHHGRTLGALKVYASAPAAFGEAEERWLELLAAAAATLLGPARAPGAPVPPSASRNTALQARETMERATGVLMARDRLGPEAARATLLETAHARGREVVEVAAEVLDAAVGHAQARRLRSTMVAADIDRTDLHLYHYSIGGSVSAFEVDAYLHHSLALPRYQRDLLAHAANEILDETAPARAPYAAEILVDPTFPTEDDARREGAAPAEDTGGGGQDAPGPAQE